MPDTGEMASRAEAFTAAVAGKDGAGACALLAPDTAESLDTGGAGCPDEVVKLAVGRGPATAVEG
ncbi:hypothetical protein GCM10022221_34080 [Actinocorallia aurea]